MPTQKGGTDQESVTQDKDSGADKNKTAAVNPRNAAIEAMAAKTVERHRAEQAQAEEQGLTYEEKDEQEGAPAEAEETPPVKAEKAAAAVEEEDDFLFEQDGKKVVKLKVNGEERLIPASEAKVILQKNVAADARLQEAAKQRRELEARERAVQAREADVQAQALKLKTTATPSADAGDPDLDKSAEELADSLLTGTKEEVTARLKTVLKTTRQAQAPVIDQKALVKQTAELVSAETAERRKNEELGTAIKQFETDFPEIAADPALFAYADRVTDLVREEHPDWTPAQIMTESGKRTTAKFAPAAPAAGDPPASRDRQERKEKLRPLPASRAGKQVREAAPERTRPSDVVADMRKARGQA